MFDVNEPVINPELVDAIEAIKNDANQSTQDDLLNVLKDAKFLSSVSIDSPLGEDGKITLKPDTIISFHYLQNHDGDNYLPVFTDWPALKQWRDIPDEKTVIINYEDIKSMVLKNKEAVGFVINPCSDNITISKDLIEASD